MSQQTARKLIIAALIPFAALTGVAFWVDGIAGFPDAITHSRASAQIYVDLVLAIVVLSVWMHRDARSNGKNPWPWIVAAAVVGMFSPLVYLLTRPSDD